MQEESCRTHVLSVVLTFVIFLLQGCSSKPSESQTDLPVPEAEPLLSAQSAAPVVQTEGPGLKKIDGIQFKIPKGWVEVPLSPAQQGMITASFKIPEAGDDIKLTLSSVGGGIDANLQRWKGQVQLPAGESAIQETVRVDNVDAIWLDLKGTYDSGTDLNSTTQSGMRMIGVAIPRMPRDFYLKLTGPREQLVNVKEQFRDFVKSARFVQ